MNSEHVFFHGPDLHLHAATSPDFPGCAFFGPPLPQRYLRAALIDDLSAANLWRPAADLAEPWRRYRTLLRQLDGPGGAVRVRIRAIDALVQPFGYSHVADGKSVRTPIGSLPGGALLTTRATPPTFVRAFTTNAGTDLDAPTTPGANPHSPYFTAQQTLAAYGEHVGLLTNGRELRVLLRLGVPGYARLPLTDPPAQPPAWFSLLYGLASTSAVPQVPHILQLAQLHHRRALDRVQTLLPRALEESLHRLTLHPDSAARLGRPPTTQALRELHQRGAAQVGRRLIQMATNARSSINDAVIDSPLRHLIDEADGLSLDEAVALASRLCTLSPALAPEEMCRVRMRRLELVVPTRQAERHGVGAPMTPDPKLTSAAPTCQIDSAQRSEAPFIDSAQRSEAPFIDSAQRSEAPFIDDEAADADDACADDDHDDPDARDDVRAAPGDASRHGPRPRFVQHILPGQLYLRPPRGQRHPIALHTPAIIARLLCRETLGARARAAASPDDPRPESILRLRVLDPCMGGGSLLIWACHLLAEHLLAAALLCHSQARAAPDSPLALDRRARLAALPAGPRLLSILGDTPADSLPPAQRAHALALCRRMVAARCLHGIDRSPLAVDLARAALQTLAHVPDAPPLELPRLLCGDALLGPDLDLLWRHPGSRKPLPAALVRAAQARVARVMRHLLPTPDEGAPHDLCLTPADAAAARAAQAQREQALWPLRVLAAAWAGGVALGPEDCDNAGYHRLLQAFGQGAPLPSHGEPFLLPMVLLGLGLEPDATRDWAALPELAPSGAPLLCPQLAFPAPFFAATDRPGFDAVLCDPPWDAPVTLERQLLGSLDLDVLCLPDRAARDQAQQRLSRDPAVTPRLHQHRARFRHMTRLLRALYPHMLPRRTTHIGQVRYDGYRPALERAARLLATGGTIGALVPASVRGQSAAPLRQLYLSRLSVRLWYTLHSHSRFQFLSPGMGPGAPFDVLVADADGPTRSYRVLDEVHTEDALETLRPTRVQVVEPLAGARAGSGPRAQP